MHYVMITHNKTKFFISEQEYKAILNAMQGGRKFAVLQGQTIPLQIAPEILEFKKWHTSEKEKCLKKNLVMCHRCFFARPPSQRCSCWASEGGRRKKNIFNEDIKSTMMLLEKSNQKMLPSA